MVFFKRLFLWQRRRRFQRCSFIFIILGPLLFINGLITSTYGFSPEAGWFVAGADCQATKKIKNGAPVSLASGKHYKLFGRNKAGGDYGQIDVPTAKPSRRWVLLSCGLLKDGNETPKKAETSENSKPLKPVKAIRGAFFDHRSQRGVDFSPPPPPLDDLDVEMLNICGEWGEHPVAADFTKELQSRPLLAEAMAKAAFGTVKAQKMPSRHRAKALTDIWFKADGFAHILCGEPGEKDLGGFHFAPRYLQAQKQGWARALDLKACRASEIAPPVYTLGVEYRSPAGRWVRDCPKGYAYDLDAFDLLVEGSRLWGKEQKAKRHGACRSVLGRSGSEEYDVIFVSKRGAIRTLYPLGPKSALRQQHKRPCGQS